MRVPSMISTAQHAVLTDSLIKPRSFAKKGWIANIMQNSSYCSLRCNMEQVWYHGNHGTNKLLAQNCIIKYFIDEY